MNGKIFTNKQLFALVIPLVIEQFLAIGVGFVDSLMVASVGEVAVSAVSIVDNISVFLISVFVAMATGGAIVISQYIGRNDIENAKLSAKQLMYSITFVAGIIAIIVMIFNTPILKLLFGRTEATVMENAKIYMFVSAISYPFLALYNGGAAIFRSIGNSKISMKVSVYMNVINVIGNAILIYVFKMGVLGAALATLVSRIFAAVMITILSCNKKNQVYIEKFYDFKLNMGIIGKILKISIPNGVDNGVFHFGKLAVVSIVATLGTASVAAHSVANSIVGIACVPATAIGYAIITVVGQCIGAKEYEQCEYFTKKLVNWAQLSFLAINVLFMFITVPMVKLFNISSEGTMAAVRIVYVHNILSTYFWPLTFTFPNALRAAGDVKYTMMVSMISMWACRVLLSYILAITLKIGVEGIWYALYADWIVRIIFFKVRFKSGKWKKNKVI